MPILIVGLIAINLKLYNIVRKKNPSETYKELSGPMFVSYKIRYIVFQGHDLKKCLGFIT